MLFAPLSPRFSGWCVAAAAAFVLFVQLGAPALWDDDEPKNAACSLAMLDANDWVVPTFNGGLRIEKPPLVNWLQIAGFTLCGRNETGARIGSALLTLGTCLLTWRIGRELLGPMVGLWSGLAMATCVWTAVGGRAATPDAPLVFFTTLALYLFARGALSSAAAAKNSDLSTGKIFELPLASSLGIGIACGAAVLTKGPVGIVLPLAAFGLFACWRWCATVTPWPTALQRLPGQLYRLFMPAGIILATVLLVAGPWYAWVGLRTDGMWLHGFFFVHNVGRFAGTMEGHSGSLFYYPTVIGVGLFPWSIVLAAMLGHGVLILCGNRQSSGTQSSASDGRKVPLQLMACWAIAWVGAFSCAGTKLPGYVWPAYPALAVGIGLFLDDWASGTLYSGRFGSVATRAAGVVMRIAWSILALTGLAIAIGLPVAASCVAADAQWLGLCGLIPIGAAIVAWRFQSTGHPTRALGTLAGCACLLVTLLAAVGAERFSRSTGARALLVGLGQPAKDCHWGCFWNIPPSLVFYAGPGITKIDTPAGIAQHLTASPQARVVIDSRHETLVEPGIPAGYGVLSRTKTLGTQQLVLIGPLPGRPLRTPLVWNTPPH